MPPSGVQMKAFSEVELPEEKLKPTTVLPSPLAPKALESRVPGRRPRPIIPVSERQRTAWNLSAKKSLSEPKPTTVVPSPEIALAPLSSGPPGMSPSVVSPTPLSHRKACPGKARYWPAMREPSCEMPHARLWKPEVSMPVMPSSSLQRKPVAARKPV